MLATMIGATHILEIGTFVGYSALWMADALPTGGTITTIEGSPHQALLARQHFAASPYPERFIIKEGMALSMLKELQCQPIQHMVDMVFIDASKSDYAAYLELTEPMVREGGLIVADKPDSQDICFVPEGRYADVILKIRPDAAETGDIVHLDGRVLGRHEGIIHYTIGQRKGLGIGGGDPLFVVKLDAAQKHVIVGPREALKQNEIAVSDLNWLGHEALSEEPIKVFVKIRSTRPAVEASIRREGEGAVVAIAEGEYGISPGQACVLYDHLGVGARVLGGGFISVNRPRVAFTRSGFALNV